MAATPELATMLAYVGTLAGQVAGARTDVESGVAAVVEEVRAIDQLARTRTPDGPDAALLAHLTAILGHLQFQDLVRQRLDQVQSALAELQRHLVARPPADVTLAERFARQQASYVMASQREAAANATGGNPPDASRAPIELF